MSGQILLVSAYFTPSRAIGARRVEKLALALHSRGWTVTVLTLQAELTGAADAWVEMPDEIEVLRTWAPIPRAMLAKFRRWSPSKTPAKAPKQAAKAPTTKPTGRPLKTRLRTLLEGDDPYDRWTLTAERAVRGRRFDVVLGSVPPRSVGRIAWRIARSSGARLVLDYRDPWIMTEHWRGLPGQPAPLGGDGSVAKLRKEERRILQDASLAISTTPTITQLIQGRSSVPVVTIPTGFAGAPKQATEPPPKPFVLAYTGSLAYGRSLSPLFHAVASLRQELPPEALRVVYCGPSSGLAQSEAAEAGVADYLDDYGSVSPEEAHRWKQRAAAVVVVVSPLYDYAYPGKIFEIMQSGRPMLTIGPRRADACELIRAHKLGWAIAAEDVSGVASAVREACLERAPTPVALETLATSKLMNEAVDAIEQTVRHAR